MSASVNSLVKFFIYSFYNFIQRTKAVFFDACLFRIGRFLFTLNAFQLNSTFKGLFNMIVFQLDTIIKLKFRSRVCREQFIKVRAEYILLMKPFIKYSGNLRNIVIPFCKSTNLTAQLIAFFFSQLIISFSDRLQCIRDFTLCGIGLSYTGVKINFCGIFHILVCIHIHTTNDFLHCSAFQCLNCEYIF